MNRFKNFNLMTLILFFIILSSVGSSNETIYNHGGQITTDIGSSPLVKLWSYKIGNSAATPAIVDITNNGDYELITTGVGGISVFSNNGVVLWNNSEFGVAEASPVVGDVDNDGNMEVFISTYDGKVVGFNAEDGSVLWNETITNGFGRIGLSLGDIDKDGTFELIANVDDGIFQVFSASNGLTHWSTEFSDGVLFQPAIGDLDNDGLDEIVVGSASEIRVMDTNGIMIWNTTSRSPAGASLADLDMDGVLDIIVGSYDGYLTAYRGNNGTLLWRSAVLGSIQIATPSIGDIDNDGYLEINISTTANVTYVFNHDGTLLWSHKLEYPMTSSSSIADVDNDDLLEVVLCDYNSTIYAFDGNGSLLWTHIPEEAAYNDISSLILFDIDQDSDLELIDIDGFDKGYSNLVVYNMGDTGTMNQWIGLRGTDAIYSHLNLARLDADSDTLSDEMERELGTDPYDPDSDDDGIPDGVEQKQGRIGGNDGSVSDNSDNEKETDEGFFSNLPFLNIPTIVISVSMMIVWREVYIRRKK